VEELLAIRNRLIFEVACEMGFSSDRYFAKWFKKHKGMTPKESRRHLQRG
jgi:YesN/AraC family two-component response regulator